MGETSRHVRIEQQDHVAILTFANPSNNHINLSVARELADTLFALDDNPSCRATVLRSEGKIFSAGADLTKPNGLADDEAESFLGSTAKLYQQAARLFSVRKPIVAAVQGPAIGAGLGLALAADFRVVAPEARFAANFVKLGFHPGFGISYTLPRVVGEQHAALMLLTGQRVSGETALAWGLADRLAPLGSLLDAALELAQEIAGNAPLAVEATRATLRRDLVEKVLAATAVEAARQEELHGTHDFAEGILAVHERRAGRFKRR